MSITRSITIRDPKIAGDPLSVTLAGKAPAGAEVGVSFLAEEVGLFTLAFTKVSREEMNRSLVTLELELKNTRIFLHGSLKTLYGLMLKINKGTASTIQEMVQNLYQMALERGEAS